MTQQRWNSPGDQGSFRPQPDAPPPPRRPPSAHAQQSMSPEPAAPSILGTPYGQPPLTFGQGTAPYFPPGPGAAGPPQPLLADVYVESTEKSWAVTLLLSIFFGMFGADRFYLGKRDTAIKKAVTFGGLGMWWLADILITAFGGQRDYAGLPLAGYHKHRGTVGWVALGLFAWPIVLGGLTVLARAVVGDLSTADSLTALGVVELASLALTIVAVVLLRRVIRRGRTHP